MSDTFVTHARSALPGPEAALLVREVSRRLTRDQKDAWDQIRAVSERIGRRHEENGFAEGILQLAHRDERA